MRAVTLRRISWLHTWSSLICTLFMLMLCVTGMPLIFHDEIDALLAPPQEHSVAAATPASLDAVVRAAQAQAPGKLVQYVYQDEGKPQVWHVMLGDNPQDETNTQVLDIHAATAQVLATQDPNAGFMAVMFNLHVELFAGLPGTLFLGVMGLLMLVAVVTGVMLYGPFMRKLGFATVRRAQSTRTRWLDWHNLLGIVTVVWLSVVTLTGVINTLGEPVLKLWQASEVQAMAVQYQGKPAVSQLASLQAAVDAARMDQPQMKLSFIAYPGTPYTSAHHYGMFMQGTTPLTTRIFKPVLVDARTAQVTGSRAMPWYVLAVLVSQPLHFGDYGGLPLKLVWAALNLIAIIVLASGVYLWWTRGKEARRLTQTAEGSRAIRHRSGASGSVKSASFAGQWGWPLLLAVLTAFGLTAALLADGVWDIVSAVAISVCIAAACVPWRRQGQSPPV
jgi:uncharacterized iron-regulated membrane protein